ncbi:MAG: hypothetical protein ABEJ05_00235 [Haloglomus sp.]
MADVTAGGQPADSTADRSVSTVSGYVLHVVIALLLVGSLVAGVAGTVTQQREHVAREELEVIGQQLAADVQSVDRLARVSDGGTVRLTATLPRRVAGIPYRIRLRDTATGGTLVLTTTEPAVVVRVSFRTAISVTPSTQRGGPVTVGYDGSTIRLGDAT